MQPFSLAIQAGGQSRRMGQDKGLMQLGGKAMVAHIIDQVRGLEAAETFIINNQPALYRSFGLPVFSDVRPGFGALGGIYTALRVCQQSSCIVLACDMPLLNLELLRYLLQFAPQFDAVVPRLQPEFAEPFRAVYRKTCLPVLEAQIDAGERKIQRFLAQIQVRWVERAEIQTFDPQLDSFRNCNTPQEFAQLKRFFNLI